MAMRNPAYSVLTVVGPDRVGIVEDIASLVASRGGNIEESRMAVLGGEFAAIMLVTLPGEALAALDPMLASLGRDLDLRLEFKRTTAPRSAGSGRPYFLETVSLDTPGIVQAVTALLKRHGINIEELETETLPAPWTGAPMFRMRATVVLGGQVSVAALRAELADLEGQKDLDISLKPAFPALPE
jgi:glycine cleavage system transcriptional repressor